MNNTSELDTQLLMALTDGIGAQLGRPVRASFFEVLKRLAKHKVFVSLEALDRQRLVDLLALSVFYNQVIAPLESGSSLLSLARRADATHVRLGRDRLTTRLAAQFRACAGAFASIIDDQNIPRDLLSFPTLTVFIDNYLETRDRLAHETMD